MEKIENLVKQLDDFDLAKRLDTLRRLKNMAEQGAVVVAPNRGWLNLHGHTFFSFNAYGYSPCRFLWEAYRAGLDMAGVVDFDVLDGLQETLAAADILGIKAEVGLETRVFIREYADRVVNSPGEPGVFYLMGAGFSRAPEQGSPAAAGLFSLKQRAQERNRLIMDRVNRFLSPLEIDFSADVLPLTPSGNATERHLLSAYYWKSRERFPAAEKLAAFWSGALDVPEQDVSARLSRPPDFQELLRAKLMKGTGVGYIKPGAGTFPDLEEAVALIRLNGGVPTATWLDGTSAGEKNALDHLAFLKGKGLEIVNIIPERNWNIKDPQEKAMKVANLNQVLAAARKLNLPVIAGTELNKHGQPLVDDFDAPELKPYLGDFQQAGRFLWEYTLRNRRQS